MGRVTICRVHIPVPTVCVCVDVEELEDAVVFAGIPECEEPEECP